MDIPLNPAQGAAFLLAALILPLVVSLVKQSGFTSQVNALIALAVYAAFAVLGAVFAGIPIVAENIVPLAIAAAVAGRLAYSMFWSLIGGDEQGNGSIDDRVTRATSIVRAPQPGG